LIRDGNVVEVRPAAGLPAGIPFSQAIIRLATSLRELHHLARIACDYPLTDENPDAFDAYSRASELISLYAA
jgi:hypothetical protein